MSKERFIKEIKERSIDEGIPSPEKTTIDANSIERTDATVLRYTCKLPDSLNRYKNCYCYIEKLS